MKKRGILIITIILVVSLISLAFLINQKSTKENISPINQKKSNLSIDIVEQKIINPPIVYHGGGGSGGGGSGGGSSSSNEESTGLKEERLEVKIEMIDYFFNESESKLIYNKIYNFTFIDFFYDVNSEELCDIDPHGETDCTMDYRMFSDYLERMTGKYFCDYVDDLGIDELRFYSKHLVLEGGEYDILETNMAMGKDIKNYWNFENFGDYSFTRNTLHKISDDLPICYRTYFVYHIDINPPTPLRTMEDLHNEFNNNLFSNFTGMTEKSLLDFNGYFLSKGDNNETKI